eukprot:365685-Chlamydomonas_euryale.AAC.4
MGLCFVIGTPLASGLLLRRAKNRQQLDDPNFAVRGGKRGGRACDWQQSVRGNTVIHTVSMWGLRQDLAPSRQVLVRAGPCQSFSMNGSVLIAVGSQIVTATTATSLC